MILHQKRLALQKKGTDLFKQKNFAEALEYFHLLENNGKTSIKLLCVIANCYLNLGNFSKTLQYLNFGYQKNPHDIILQKSIRSFTEKVRIDFHSLVHLFIPKREPKVLKDNDLIELRDQLEYYYQTFDFPNLHRMFVIINNVPGYGTIKQFSFFNFIVSQIQPKRILLIGVYRGRDTCFILEAARHHQLEISFTGVDKFSDDFCEDWPEELKQKTWEQAGFGTAPSIEETKQNLSRFGFNDVNLIEMRDEDFLSTDTNIYDFIYLDTSHDYKSVRRQIQKALRLSHPNTIISGDDYSDEGTWGVKKAVEEGTLEHGLYLDWIWYVHAKNCVDYQNTIRVAKQNPTYFD